MYADNKIFSVDEELDIDPELVACLRRLKEHGGSTFWLKRYGGADEHVDFDGLVKFVASKFGCNVKALYEEINK